MAGLTDSVPPTGTGQTDVEGFMADSARRILSIRLLQFVGAPLPTTSSLLRWNIRPAGATALICLTPLLLELLTYSNDDGEILTDHRALAALGYFFVLNLFCFWCPYYIWHRVIGLAPEVDDALVDAGSQVHRPLDRARVLDALVVALRRIGSRLRCHVDNVARRPTGL